MSRPVPLPHAGLASQATAIEQSRAIAEVQAAVLVAQNNPRDEARAIREMEAACKRPTLATRAFYEYERGGKPVIGATVKLARELARIWGNIDYKVVELSRQADQSEMLAAAWDLQTNARASTSWIVPTKRYTGGGATLTQERDIYENNANTGARRVREQIFAVLPQWFHEDAQEACRATLAALEGGAPLAERVDLAIAKFGEIGVSLAQLVRRLDDRAPHRWTVEDVAALGITMRSIKSGELKVDDAFPPVVIDVTTLGTGVVLPTPPAAPQTAGTTPVDGAGAPASVEVPAPSDPAASPPAGGAGSDDTAAQAPESPLVEPAPSSEKRPTERPAVAAQKKRIAVLATEAGLDDAGRLELVAVLAGRPVESTNELGMREAADIVERLEQMAKGEDFPAAVDQLLREAEAVRMEAEIAAAEAVAAEEAQS